MIAALAPGFLAVGALFAALPVVLHLLSRRPPDREALPTARFLVEDRRTLLRPTRRPSDLPLLVVRVLFALVLGAAFAGLTWLPERTERVRVLLVDVDAVVEVGADQLTAAVGAATSATSEGWAVRTVAYARGADGSLLTSHDPTTLFDRIGEPRSTAHDGLRALRSVVGEETRADSVEVVWLLQPTWRQWSRGIGLTRPTLWPGAIQVRPVGEPSTRAAPTTTPEATAPEATTAETTTQETTAQENDRIGVVGLAVGSPVHRALEALGRPAGGGPTASTVIGIDPATDLLDRLVSAAEAGGTIVLSGTLPQGTTHAGLPWRPGPSAPEPTTPTALVHPGRSPLSTSAIPSPGGPAPGAFVVAVTEAGHPAAAFRPIGDGCVVYSAIRLDDPELSSASGYVDYLDDLIDVCSASARGIDPGAPLDPGAMSSLARADLPARIAAADLGGTAGTKLAPWLLLLALALLGCEVALTRRRAA